MSKDKAGKKDKWKHLDLFDMMLKQSQVFRDMVGQFQSAWVPQAPSVVIEASVGSPSAAKKPGRATKVAPAAAPARKSAAKKPVAKKAVAAKKPALAPVKPSSRKSSGNTKAASSSVKSAAPRKTAGKAAATRRVTRKK